MQKPIIGIIGPRTSNEARAFKNYTQIVDNYPKRIREVGGIPIGICFPYGQYYEDALALCDGFIFTGGPKVEAAQINAMGYAIKHNKPVLGICLGMQTMAAYEWASKKLCSNGFDSNEVSASYKIEDEIYYMDEKGGHNDLDPFYNEQIEKSKHEVILTEDSHLYSIYQRTQINEPSIHNWVLKGDVFNGSEIFKVTGRALDGTIEAIESKNSSLWIVGTQFHPELENENKVLFDTFIKEVNVRRK